MKAYPAFSTKNNYAPKEGPKVKKVVLDFTVNLREEINLLLDNLDGDFAFAQSVFVDNSGNMQPLILNIPVTGQRLICPSASQGTFPLYGIDQTQIICTVLQVIAGADTQPYLLLCNFTQPYNTWSAV